MLKLFLGDGMKMKYSLLIIVLLLTSCTGNDVQEVSYENDEEMTKLTIDKNQNDFNNDETGKRQLLTLMANSADYYHYLSGSMIVTQTYQGNSIQYKYQFQINLDNYHSYIYQIASNSLKEQFYFRDQEKMYFYYGNLKQLETETLSKLQEENLLVIEKVPRDDILYQNSDQSLEQRIADLNSTRVPHDLFGDVAPYVFPEEIALYQLGLNYNNYHLSNTSFLEKETFLVEGSINQEYYNPGSISMIVDKQTGILLKYQYTTDISSVEMVMEELLIDQAADEDYYLKYIKKI